MSPWFRRPAGNPFVSMTPAERAIVVGLLAAVGVLTFPFALAAGDESRLMLYAAFLVYLCVLALPFLVRQWTPGIFHPLVFYVIWVGMQGLLRGEMVLPVTGLDYHRALSGATSGDLDLLVATSFLLETVAILSLYAGYVMAPRFRVRQFAVPQSQWLGIKSVLWVGVAGLGLLALATIGGGLDQVLMQRGIASDQRIGAQVGGHWGYLAGIGVVAPLVWLACDRHAVRSPLFWGVVIVALGIKFASTGSRGGTIGPLIMIGAIYVLQHRVVPYRAVLVGILAALVLVGGLGQYRLATMQAKTFDQVTVQGGPLDWMRAGVEEMQRGAGENSGQLAVLGRVPEEVPHLWGESYLSIPFIFVPSAVWGEKPDAAGKLNAARIYGNPLNAIPPGPVGEAYWNFSFPGIVVVFLLYGALLRLVEGFYRANPAHPLVLLVFVYILFHMQPHSPSVYGFFHALVPAVVIFASFLLPFDGRIRFKQPANALQKGRAS
jgi:hypothetical protein